MPFLTKTDLTPPIYPEILEVITRGDDTIINKCINNAIGEMKAYLARFDTLAMFGIIPVNGQVSADGMEGAVEPTYRDEHLSSIGKDIACWHLIKLANPNIDVALFRTMYEDAINYLKMVQGGKASPGWPLKPPPVDPNNPFTNPAALDDGSLFTFSSNLKRQNHY
ncbi:MAG: DUF1320 domain-containing protein [Sphingobacteriales bacterium]|nr:MAG: DUF1320 domain-containing protein [Sphingobacteriales bacterium]